MRFETKLLALSLCLMTGSAARAEGQCRAADSTSAVMVGKYKSNLRSTDGNMKLWLSRNGIPSTVDPNTVVLVTDRNVCSKAERTYSTALKNNGVTPSGSVYVVKIGTVYVVKDPVQTSSGWAIEMVLDNQFKIKKSLLA